MSKQHKSLVPIPQIHVFWDCFNRLDSVLSSPHIVRLVRTSLYMLYIIHLNCCAYYTMSTVQGIGSNPWVFSGEGHRYENFTKIYLSKNSFCINFINFALISFIFH